MNQPRLKMLLLGLVVALTLTAAASQADAGWWGCRPVCASYDFCSVGCYDPCCGPSWYAGWRPGPIRRLVFGPYRWYPSYYGNWNCCTSCCGVAYTAPACCGRTYTVGCCGDMNGTVVPGPMMAPAAPVPGAGVPTPAPAKAPAAPDAGPVMPTAPAPTGLTPPPAPLSSPTITTPPAAPAVPAPAKPASPSGLLPGEAPAIPGATSYVPTSEDSALLSIWVPAEAKVTINGLATRSSGSRRQYVSYGLQPGFSYKYEVRAQIVRDGQVVEESRTISLTAGQRGAVAFGFNTRSAEGLAATN